MSLDNKFKRNTHFVAGFSFKGKRTSDVGEDLLTATGIDAETMDGTPVVFDGDIDTVAVAGAGVEPDAYLYSRISEKLSDFEWLVTDIVRDEVKKGDPFTIILHKKGGIIKTNLATTASLASDDEVAIGASDSFVAATEAADEQTIANANITVDEWNDIEVQDYVEGSFVVTQDGDTLEEGTDYEIDYTAHEFMLLDNDDTDADVDAVINADIYAGKPVGKVLETDSDDEYATIILK